MSVIFLLIVPYGIETYRYDATIVRNMSLLIVPYGIETNKEYLLKRLFVTFNCTLWN